MTFTIYPAIDLRHGRCVRLIQGDFNRETVFSDDPVAVAERWAAAGAEWLHVVDLDAAGGDGDNLASVHAICAAVAVPVQMGGGMRALADIERAFAAGVRRAVIGTAAVESPAMVAAAVAKFGEHVAVGLDGREGVARTRGWREDGAVTLLELGKRMKGLGVARFIYTDIGRDGMLDEPNYRGLVELIAATQRPVIASGGVATVDQVRKLKANGAEGVILGKALYTGAVLLESALKAVTA